MVAEFGSFYPDELVLRDGTTSAQHRLADGMRWCIEGDLSRNDEWADRYHGRDPSLTLAHLSRGRAGTGSTGDRVEVALFNLLRREESAWLHRRLGHALAMVTSHGPALEVLPRAGEEYDGGVVWRLRAVALSREKAGRRIRERRLREDAILGEFDDLRGMIADDAVFLTPGHRAGLHNRLVPGADRRRDVEDTRLYALLTTPTSMRLPLPPNSRIGHIHHADLLVGTYDGRFWFGVDIKTFGSSRPSRQPWAGIAVHLDILVRREFGQQFVDPDDDLRTNLKRRAEGRPTRVTIEAETTPLAAVADAEHVLALVDVSYGDQLGVSGGNATSVMLRAAVQQRDAPLADFVDALDQRWPERGLVVAPTDHEVGVYGNPEQRPVPSAGGCS